ncbi:siderophore-interacting protein [Microbacterium hominis]|uniref:siderophore-interacting protein n=1 Tax=Microbacterium hominis TaxID=162426 RepID=UPI0007687460|nr:siderophore-interacting protein [Microbacterium hominis]KXC06893.1 siderophore-interacting protein [Microbacterium hominis]
MSAAPTAVRPAYRPYSVRVQAVRRLAPHYVRVTFTSPQLEWFGTAGLDQRIKIVLPLPGIPGGFADLGQDEEAGDWYDRWRALPADQRNPFRTYTVRRVDAAARELDVDFVIHHDAGPAGAWADGARIGDELIIVGPDERSPQSRVGIDWHPGSARRLLLAGDETAAPAICGILESLDPRCEVDAFIEVPTAEDALRPALPATSATRLSWIARGDRAHGLALIDAIMTWTAAHGDVLARAASPRPQVLDDIDVDRDLLWDSPEDGDGEFYSWIAGEAGTVKTLRRLLVSGCGVDRKRVAFMGYWRLGQAERVE